MIETRANLPRLVPGTGIPIFADGQWQMSLGERAALEGVLAQVRPRLAIEIGTAEGGSLARMAAHSAAVHAFDLVAPAAAAASLANVTVHTGDSHALLPELLRDLAADGRNVDFVLVDGDHSAEGARQDMQDLLDSPAIGSTVILAHDSMNPDVRAGLDRVDYDAIPKVAHVELDFVPGYLFHEPSLRNELWGGLALVVVDAARAAYGSRRARPDRYYEAFGLMRAARELVLARGHDEDPAAGGLVAEAERVRTLEAEHELRLAELRHDNERLRADLTRADAAVAALQASLSWRLTAPLRRLKRARRG